MFCFGIAGGGNEFLVYVQRGGSGGLLNGVCQGFMEMWDKFGISEEYVVEHGQRASSWLLSQIPCVLVEVDKSGFGRCNNRNWIFWQVVVYLVCLWLCVE